MADIKDHIVIQQIIEYAEAFEDTQVEGGEANIGQNVGLAGVGVYEGKDGVILQFRNIRSIDAVISVALNAGNKTIDIDFDESQINHGGLNGVVGTTYSHTNIDTHIDDVTGNPHDISFTNMDGGTISELNSLISDATVDDITGKRESQYQTIQVINDDTATFDVFDVVFVADGNGVGAAQARLADAKVYCKSDTLGVVISSILVAGQGDVVHFGKIVNVDTQAWAAGAKLYLDPTTPGQLTDTLPVGDGYRIQVATVLDSDAAGSIFVQPVHETQSHELHEAVGWQIDALSFMRYEFDNATRTMTLRRTGAKWVTYEHGDRYEHGVVDGPDYIDEIVIPDTEGLHLVFYDGLTLDCVLAPTTEQVIAKFLYSPLVAWIYWDADNNKCIYLGREPHYFALPPNSHILWHLNVGAQYQNGFALNSFNIGTGALDADAQFSSNAGAFSDEDLYQVLAAIASTEGLPVFYHKDGFVGEWRRDDPTGYSVKSFTAGSLRLAYNEYVVEIGWRQTEVGNGEYVWCHVFGSNDVWDTVLETATRPGIFAVQGQFSYGSINDAQDGLKAELSAIASCGMAPQEQFPIGSVLFQTSNAYANAPKARVVQVDGENYVNWLGATLSQVSQPQSHLSLADKNAGTDGDGGHIYMTINAGRTGGQTLIGGTVTEEDLELRNNSVDTVGVTVAETNAALNSFSSRDAWVFDSATADADPGTGGFRLSATDRDQVVWLCVSFTSAGSVDFTDTLNNLRTDDILSFQESSDETANCTFRVVGEPEDKTTYCKIPVVFIRDGSTAFTDTNESRMTISFAATQPIVVPAKTWEEYYGVKYSCVGDSNTIGVTGSGYSYPAALSEHTHIAYANLGVGGKKSDEIVSEQIPTALTLTDSVVQMMAGTNDQPNGYTEAQTKQYLEAGYQDILGGDKVPLAIGILPGASGTYKTIRDSVNAWIPVYSSAVYFVDVSEFDDGSGGLKAAYDYGDGVHLNVAGMEKLAELIQNVLPTYPSFNFRRTGTIDTQSTVNRIAEDPSTWADQVALNTWLTGQAAPDGSNTAYGMVATTADTQHYARGTASGASGAEQRFEGVWLKAGECEWVKLLNSSNGSSITFNLRTGNTYAKAGSYLDDFGIVPAGSDGWAYVWMESNTSLLTNDKLTIQPFRGAEVFSFVGDGTLPECYVWQPFKGTDHLPIHYREVV